MKEKVMILKNFVFITVAEYAFVQFNLSQSVCRRNTIVGDRQTDTHTNRQTHRRTDRQTDEQPDEQQNKQK